MIVLAVLPPDHGGLRLRGQRSNPLEGQGRAQREAGGKHEGRGAAVELHQGGTPFGNYRFEGGESSCRTSASLVAALVFAGSICWAFAYDWLASFA